MLDAIWAGHNPAQAGQLAARRRSPLRTLVMRGQVSDELGGYAMAAGCRDCETCTRSWLGRLFQNAAVGLMHVVTIGISYLIKKGFRRHCPQCGHLLSRHARRADGSFRD
ncbi:hypothetical protein [Streptomyces rhizosphaericus]|uniref:hypothetical protein n=1 Tax=Streptomyces rhizosphaericus TaxID=114699 RepID=UPI00202ED832|nr:hypothetical protein [Streptomyces rhizosphaericus]